MALHHYKSFIYIATVILSLLMIACPIMAMTPEQQNEALTIHNKLRAIHDAPPLQWDDELARYAANYASGCQFKHSHGNDGENLAAGFRTTTAAIMSWYSENKNYSYKNGNFDSRTGHFTQLVWKSSTKLGCASVPCDGKNGTPGNFLVCEYNPPGNIINQGYFQENVTPRRHN